MKRKILAALLAVMMVVTMLPLSVMAADEETFTIRYRDFFKSTLNGTKYDTKTEVNINTESMETWGADTFKHAGYTFMWNSSSNGQGGINVEPGAYLTKQQINTLIGIAEKQNWSYITLNAIWTPNTDTPYKVKHILMNVAGDKVDKAYATYTSYGTTDTLTNAAAIEIEGYTPMDFEQLNIKGNGSTVVEIKYQKNTYTLTYVLDGGEFVDGTEPVQEGVAYNKTLTLPQDPVKDGYTFLGWDVELPEKMPANDLTLTAQWAKNAVEFTFRNASVNNQTWHGGFTKSLDLDQDYTIPAVADTFNARPVHYYDSVGYTFVGWVDGLGNVYEDGDTISKETVNALYEAGKTTITSKWEAINYTLQFNAGKDQGLFNNGTRFFRVDKTVEDGSFTFADILNEANEEATRPGYELLGWRVGGTKYALDTEFTVEQLLEYAEEQEDGTYKIKITAVWDASDVYVDYEFTTDAGRELPAAVKEQLPTDETVYHAGDTVEVMDVATKTVEVEDGTWTFDGWNLKEGASSFTVQPEDAETGVTITGNWTFTAKTVEPVEEPKPEPKFDMPRLNLRSIVIDTTEGGKTDVSKGRCYGALGSTHRLTLTPDEGYEIGEVLVNGKPVEANKKGKISFVVTGNTYVEVEFVEIEG